MATLTAAVVALAALTLLNLVLLLGVIRRIRTQVADSAHNTALALPDNPVLKPGSPVGAFSATTTDGDAIGLADLGAGDTLVGFFSSSCKPCRTAIPRFTEYARSFAGGRERVLAVVVTNDQDYGEYAELLSPAARVVVEPHAGSMSQAFEVAGFPGLCIVGTTGTVTANGMRLEELSAKLPAHV